MRLEKLLAQKSITKYELAKRSGVPKTTILDIFSGKREIENCTVKTIYSIAQVLDTTVENILSLSRRTTAYGDMNFENFKSTVCHELKAAGDLDFLITLYENNDIRTLYESRHYAKAFYLLALADYLSRVNQISLCRDYADLRTKRLSKTLYPADVKLAHQLLHTQDAFEKAKQQSIPEFLTFNIVESEVRNVI